MSSTIAVVAAACGLAGWALFYVIGIVATLSRTRRPTAESRNPNE